MTPKVPVHAATRSSPLSRAQRGMWFAAQLHPTSSAYHLMQCSEVRGPLDTARLEAALQAFVQRHEALRTSFHESPEGPYSLVHPEAELSLLVRTAGGDDAADPQALISSLVLPELEKPFDLTAAPLFRATAIRLSDDRWILALVAHHLVWDDGTDRIRNVELAELYRAGLEGRAPELVAPPPRFRDYVEWETQALADPGLAGHESYWRQQLDGVESPFWLGAPWVRAAEGTVAGTHRLTVPGDVTPSLRAFARSSGCSLFMVLLAAFHATLHRYTGERSIVTATPMSQRWRAGFAEMAGLLVNMCPIRTRVHPAMPFQEVLRQVRRAVSGALEHSQVPYERIVQVAAPGRIPGRDGVTDVTFQLLGRDDAGSGLELAGADVGRIELPDRSVRFGLEFDVVEADEGLRISINYRARDYSSHVIEALAAHFVNVLVESCARPAAELGTMRMLSTDDERHLKEIGTGPRVDLSAHPQLVEMFVERCARTPDQRAVIDRDAALTYAELERASAELATALAELGVGPGRVVGVLLGPSIELVTAVLGVARSGAAYLPIDPSTPATRVRHLLDETHACAMLGPRLGEVDELLSAGVTLERRAGGVNLLVMEAAAGGGDEPLPREVVSVVYTSGSTGEPRGVMVSGAGLVNLVQWHVRQYRLSAADRTTLYASSGFDASAWELWPTLCAGGTLVVVPGHIRADLTGLRDWLASAGVTVCFLPTPVAEPLMTLTWPPGTRLRYLLTGGDRLRSYPSGKLPFHVVNHYGPTEATVLATAVDLTDCDRGSAASPPVGRPIDNTALYVVDESQRLSPLGAAGEIVIGGTCVTLGYLARDRETAERFDRDPFRPDGSGRTYRTGDIGRWRPDGLLEFLGRRDRQVQVRGYRIEPAEIEKALLSHPDVINAAVTTIDRDGGAQSLVGYVVPTGDERPGAENPEQLRLRRRAGALEIKQYVAQRLPGFMVPADIVELAALPLTDNGKVDHRALPDPVADREVGRPRQEVSELHEKLAVLWCEVLRLDHAEADENFFDLGGHSLYASHLATRIRQAFGIDIPLSDVFDAPTIATQAIAIQKRLTSG